MCYATKIKIADCVKELMRKKEISKIRIGDIMNATGMSRQSFYYHFQDIYEVLEWIGCTDFKEQLEGDSYNSLCDWACDLMTILQANRSFYEKLANEIAWPAIIRCVKPTLLSQVRHLLLCENREIFEGKADELDAVTNFLSTSICYYMIDFVYNKKVLSIEQVRTDVQFMMRAILKDEPANVMLQFTESVDPHKTALHSS